MNFPTSITTCFRKYATFKGRATRSEYWWFTLFLFLGLIALSVVEKVFLGIGEVTRGPGSIAWESNGGPLTGIFLLAMIVPSLAVAVRRLHDLGKSGWMLLLQLVPLIGAIALLYFLVQPSQPGPNAFGPAPDGNPPSLP